MTEGSRPVGGLKEKLDRFRSDARRLTPFNAVVTLPRRAIYRKERLSTGDLQGRTVAVKDNIAVRGWPLSCASRILKNYISPYSATVVDRIVDHGGVIVAKTNHDEFAMGSSSEHSVFGPVKNPVDMTRVPGGSSGGSAVAVALGLTDLALGSDTGGSVRQPAAFCGVFGLKPTYGRVSRYGLVAFASSFDQIGPFAGTTRDLALLLRTIAGRDPKDSTSVDVPVPDYVESLQNPLPRKVGIPRDILTDEVDGEIMVAMERCRSFLERKGCTVSSVSLPHVKYAISTYYILTTAEASSNLARFDGSRYGLSRRDGSVTDLYRKTRSEGFGQEVKRRIMLGTYVLSAGYYEAYYRKAQKVRRLIRDDFVSAFNEVDAILLPASPTPPFKLGERLEDPLMMYLSDIFTAPISLAGVPAVSFPAGTHSTGLPIGLQLVGNHFQEETILTLCHYIEEDLTS
ncbi:MAG: Asp-tRNA(Asn)/Glu-tRNA(Gln) amidotransferase subunit GatA [Fidelibacterota bacterium]